MAIRTIKKTILILLSVIVIALVAIILFISPLTKYLIEKYDVKITGRQITMDWAYVNPFSGFVHFSNLKIYEEKSDSVALSAKGISAQFDLRKLLSKEYIISELTLDHARWNIIKTPEGFNFMSFINAFSSKKPDSTTISKPSAFNILKVRLIESEVHYLQPSIPVNYFIRRANIESEGPLLNADTVLFKFFFLSGPGSGSMQGIFRVNFKNLNYRYAVVVHKFDLTQIEQYIRPFINYGVFRANLDADMVAVGNFKNGQDVTAIGRIDINDFHFGKNRNEDYLSFNKLTLAINELSPFKKVYRLDSVYLDRPFVKYEQYYHLDNLETMFGEKGGNIKKISSNQAEFNLIIEIARYARKLAQNFFESYYKINKLEIHNAYLKYNDFSLSEKFSVGLNPLNIIADSIDKNKNWVNVSFKSGIEPYGNVAINLSISPKDTGSFNMNYHIQKVPASLFNPYLITYTSFPLDRGTIEFNGSWDVRSGIIESNNHFVILDPRVTKRLKRKDAKWIPAPLIMALVRSNGNAIDYEIPITGNLKNPKFHMHDLVLGVLKNIFIKPPTIPYRMEVRNVENEIENLLTLKWEMRQTTLPSNEEEFVNNIADFLIKNPNASITVHPEIYTSKEKEYILFFEAKKKYYENEYNKSEQQLAEEDSEKIEKMSIRDSSFRHYMKKQNNDSMLFSIQDKCLKLVGQADINAKFKQLNAEREKCFLSYFKAKGVSQRVNMVTAENIVPYNGFSFYKIEYKGEMPQSLIKAHEKMKELNNEGPRKQFEKERKKDKAPLYDLKAK